MPRLASTEEKRKYDREYYQLHRVERMETARAFYRSYNNDYRTKALARYQTNRQDPLWVAKQRKSHSDRMKKFRLEILSHYSPRLSCQHCGCLDIRVLTLDHKNGDGNMHRRELGGTIGVWRSLKRKGYPNGYRVLCYNCQKIVEDEKWENIWQERMTNGFVRVRMGVVK